MDDTLLLALVAVLLVVSLLALALALVALRRTAGARRTSRRDPASVPADVAGLRSEVQALRGETADALRHLAVVRYDAYDDMGGRLSWSLALLDESGDGVVLTSIHGRSEARTYAKGVRSWSCEQATSPEEDEAVQMARTVR